MDRPAQRRFLIGVRRLWLIATGCALVVGVLIGVAVHLWRQPAAAASPLRLPALHGEATWAAGVRPAPAFTLRDQTGRSVSLTALRGRAVVLAFMDSRCRQACPVEGKMIAAAVRQVRRAARPQLLVVSVDPAGDTPTSIRRATRAWRLPGGVRWLVGSRAALRRVWHLYDIAVLPTAGDILHSTAVYVIDPRGDERAGFLVPFVPGLLAGDLRVLAT